MVPNGWKRTPIKGVCESIIDCVNKTAPVVGYETPFKMIRTTNVRNGRVNTEEVRYVTEETYEQWVRRGKPQAGDIILTREAPVGEVGILEQAEGIFLGQRTMMYRADSDRSDNYYLFYSLSSTFCQKQIADFSNGGTVAHMRVPDCGEILINLPPLLEQKRIAAILSTWDEAIFANEDLLANSRLRKKALMQQLLTGKKRLPGFEEEWEFRSFSQIFTISNQKNCQVKTADYQLSGTVPIVDQGKSTIAGYCSNTTPYQDVPVIVFGDHTRVVKWVDFPFCPGADGTQVLKAKDYMNPLFAYYCLSYIDLPNLGYSRHMRELKEREFKIPIEIEVQDQIASILKVADEEIEALEQRINNLKLQKKALMQQLLTGKKRVKVDPVAA